MNQHHTKVKEKNRVSYIISRSCYRRWLVSRHQSLSICVVISVAVLVVGDSVGFPGRALLSALT